MSEKMPVAQTIDSKSAPVSADRAQTRSAKRSFENERKIAAPATLPSWRLTLCVVAASGALIFLTLLVAGILAGSLYYGLQPLITTGATPGVTNILVAVAGIMFAAMLLLPVLLAHRVRDFPGLVPVDRESGLKQLVTDIAERLQVPAPSNLGMSQRPVVRLNCRSRGLKADLGGTELVLGLPLVRCLSTRELGGMIAHELGHFAEPAGRQERYLILAINQWLIETANAGKQAGFLKPGAMAVGVGAKVVGQISAPVLREMEEHGDWYQVQIAGSKSFKSLAENAHLILRSYEGVHAELIDEDNDEYPADVSHLIVERMHKKAVDDQRYLREVMLESPSCINGDHPPGYDRLDAVENHGEVRGVLLAEAPAVELLEAQQALSRRVTLAWFRQVLGLDISDTQLVSETAIVRKLEAHRELNQVLDNYFLGFFHRTRFLPPGDISAALKVPAEQRLAKIEKACEEIRRISPEARRALGEYDDAIGVILDDARAAVRTEAEGTDHPTDTIRQAQRAYKDANSELADLEQRFAERMALGLAGALADAVLSNPQVAKIMHEEIGKLNALQTAFARCREPLFELRVQIVRLNTAKKIAATELVQSHNQTIARLVSKIGQYLDKLPSVDLTDKRSLVPAIDAEVDAASDGSIESTAKAFVRAVERHYLLLLVRLSEIALETEARHDIRLRLID